MRRLNADEIEKLVVDATLGRGPSIKGATARLVYCRLRRQVRAAARLGLVIEVPSDSVDLDKGGESCAASD